MFSNRAVALFGAALFAAASLPAAASKLTVNSVGAGLMCQCGCNIPVGSHCQHPDCPSHAEMRALIQKKIDAGEDETAIRQDFVKQYGIQALATPPEHGFFLTVWILPALGLVLGLGAVMIFVRRWYGKRTEFAPPPNPEIDPKILAAIDEEMKKVSV